MNARAMCAELHEIKLFMVRHFEKGNNIAMLAKAQALQFINKVTQLPTLASPDANALVDAFDLAPFERNTRLTLPAPLHRSSVAALQLPPQSYRNSVQTTT